MYDVELSSLKKFSFDAKCHKVEVWVAGLSMVEWGGCFLGSEVYDTFLDKEQDVMTLEEVEDMGMLIFHKRDLQMGGRF